MKYELMALPYAPEALARIIIRGYKQNKLITPGQNKLINFFVVWKVCYLR